MVVEGDSAEEGQQSLQQRRPRREEGVLGEGLGAAEEK
jgi:hypothetical protein